MGSQNNNNQPILVFGFGSVWYFNGILKYKELTNTAISIKRTDIVINTILNTFL